MKHIRSLLSTTQTLRHLFLSPLRTPRTAFLPSSHIQSQVQLRSIYYSRRHARLDPYVPPQEVKDENIHAQFIQVVNDEGKLDPPERLRDVLRSIERPDNYVLQVTPGDIDTPPVCKIVNRKEAKEAEKARSKAVHVAKTSVKQVELNWAIDGNDLSHRLKQLEKFLDKGRKVEIILTRKKGKRPPTVDEVKHVMDSVLETVRAADSMQLKPMEGEPGRHVVFVVKKKDT